MTAATRVPQEERTRAMRLRLLDATIDCLVEHGWSGTSTTLVSQRALYGAKNSLIATQLAALTTRVTLYRVLGGGLK